ncbi:hypothetical protein D9756_004210 [Leucocoprinus leucothites]|uniref:chitinase n=1 Tax=Leucocoprinus leucothites TaxID=201217 RepID=A0A8H5D8T5_9AGAR|nr:hypothetical protein D9756_004210 [Leucoagaricus leucothites]
MTFWRAGLAFFLLYLAGIAELNLVAGFSNSRSDNLAVTQELTNKDDAIDVIPMAFLYVFFGEGGKPIVDFSNICSQGGAQFPNSDLADCSFLASDIKTCQSKGKLVTISLGGATAKVGFSSAGQANDFAETVWDMFLGGKSNTRPFGDAVLDGVDLDIESGSPSHYSTYYITAAPQCPFPDAKIGDALDNANFDAVYVQFYNNYCETSRLSDFNFATWDRWAKTSSPNPNVKVYIGAPAGPKAAGSGSAQNQYSSFGGVMLWDADTAYTNDRFDLKIKKAIVQKGRSSSDLDSDETPNSDEAPDSDEVPDSDEAPNTSDTSSAIPEATVPADFRDPREKARVKRPTSYTIMQPEKRDFGRPRALSRAFRF